MRVLLVGFMWEGHVGTAQGTSHGFLIGKRTTFLYSQSQGSKDSAGVR